MYDGTHSKAYFLAGSMVEPLNGTRNILFSPLKMGISQFTPDTVNRKSQDIV